MKLQTRMLTGFAIVLVMVAGLGLAVVVDQRRQLIDQLDRRLEAVVPLSRPGPPRSGPATRPADAEGDGSAPISDVFIATLDAEGGPEELVVGQLLVDQPRLDDLPGEIDRGRLFLTVDSVGGTTRFRALVEQPDGAAVATVIALPTTDVDETLQRLTVMFSGVVFLTGAILGMLAWWITRLGLAPISEMTATARQISAGERDRRAPEIDQRTEAGELAAAFNIMLDQRDEAENRLRRFASDASHELRTPLTSIQGYLDLYADGGFRGPGELDDVVRRMRNEAGRMGTLVAELLQLARHDEGRAMIVSPVDLGELVRDVVDDTMAGHPDRTVVAHAPKPGRAVAEVDRDKITQLITVLIHNALLHAPGADIEVRVELEPETLTLVVADDGPGLSEEHAARVFERFYRADSSRSRSAGGSGLGLAIAASIAEAHGATIDLRTAPERGCTFSVTIRT